MTRPNERQTQPDTPGSANGATGIGSGEEDVAGEVHRKPPTTVEGCGSGVRWSDLNFSTYAVYGSAWIFAVDTMLFPLEVLKTRIMSQRGDRKPVMVSSMLKTIIRQEGFFKLFRGIAPSVVGSFPGQATYYTTYELSSHRVRDHLPPEWRDDRDPLSGFVIHSVAGGMAEVAAGTFYVPADIVSQRLQVQGLENSAKYSGAFDVIRTTLQREGVRGFYRGYTAYIMAYAPGSAIYWGSYETFKKLWFEVFGWANERFGSVVSTSTGMIDSESSTTTPSSLPPQDVSQGGPIASPSRADVEAATVFTPFLTAQTTAAYVHALSGACAGFCSCVANNPFDMMRTRIQLLEPGRDDRDFQILKNRGYWSYFSTIAREEGARAFYRGLKPRLIVAIPGSVLALSGYEAIKMWSASGGTLQEDDPPPLHRVEG